MREATVHCSARDQDVRVLLTDEPAYDGGQASIGDAELLCLAIGEACTGALCPLGATSPAAMDARLVHAGLDPRPRLTVRMRCEACGHLSDWALSVGCYATCEECGTTRHLEAFTQ